MQLHDYNLFQDSETASVAAMHMKFGFTVGDRPQALPQSLARERADKMAEELEEFRAAVEKGNLADMADALVDLVVFAKGTAVMMGLPWGALWREVYRANMSKERGEAPNRPGHKQDLVKPDGWTPPDIKGILNALLSSDDHL